MSDYIAITCGPCLHGNHEGCYHQRGRWFCTCEEQGHPWYLAKESDEWRNREIVGGPADSAETDAP